MHCLSSVSYTHLDVYKRHVLKRTENGILKNGVGARSIDILNSGDTLTLNLPSDEGTASAVPADIQLDIIYEDDDILVINKKHDIAMHESHNHRCDALSNAVAFHLMKEGKECVFRSVGRLDKGDVYKRQVID